MSESKFKAPKAVMDELDRLYSKGDSIYRLLFDIKKSSVLRDYVNYQMRYAPIDVIDQAIIDYVIWKKDTFELEREPHYVIYRDTVVIGFAVFYLYGGRIPIDYIESCEYEDDVDGIEYDEGWPKEEAERLNKTIKGKLVEVK